MNGARGRIIQRWGWVLARVMTVSVVSRCRRCCLAILVNAITLSRAATHPHTRLYPAKIYYKMERWTTLSAQSLCHARRTRITGGNCFRASGAYGVDTVWQENAPPSWAWLNLLQKVVSLTKVQYTKIGYTMFPLRNCSKWINPGLGWESSLRPWPVVCCLHSILVAANLLWEIWNEFGCLFIW